MQSAGKNTKFLVAVGLRTKGLCCILPKLILMLTIVESLRCL